jgi:hypothetical protein
VLAVGGEAKMPGLDDAGVHRTDGDLVQAFALDRQEGVGRVLLRRLLLAERLAHLPEAEVEPRSRVGRARSFKAEQVADGALEPDRRRMFRADTRIAAVLAGVSQHDDVVIGLAEQRHVHVGCIAPQPEQRATSGGKEVDRLPPAFILDSRAWPRPVPLGNVFVRNGVEQGHDAIPGAVRRSESR